MNILAIKLECVSGCYLEKKVSRECEIPESYTLEALCDFVLESFDFENDHMHEFFISINHNPYGANIIKNESKTLKDIFPLESSYNLFMHFDYGDDWVFKISKMRNKVEFKQKTSYPKVNKKIGQVEQYPMCEEDDD